MPEYCKVDSFPAGARVVVDGKDTGKVTPASGTLAVGTHTVTVQAGAVWQPVTQTVVVGTSTTRLSVTLLPVLTTGPQGLPGTPGSPGLLAIQARRARQERRGPSGCGNASDC